MFKQGFCLLLMHVYVCMYVIGVYVCMCTVCAHCWSQELVLVSVFMSMHWAIPLKNCTPLWKTINVSPGGRVAHVLGEGEGARHVLGEGARHVLGEGASCEDMSWGRVPLMKACPGVGEEVRVDLSWGGGWGGGGWIQFGSLALVVPDSVCHLSALGKRGWDYCM